MHGAANTFGSLGGILGTYGAGVVFGSDRVVERGVEGHRGGLFNRRRGLAVLFLGREGF